MADAPLIGKREFDHSGPVIRLLYCLVCNTMEELPPHDGPSDEDFLLEITLEKHKFPSGDPHVGKLFILPVKTWANVESRKAIIEQLKGNGAQGLDAIDPDSNFYETKMQFADDAMECWKKHLSPTDNCDDYQSPAKRLLPKTAAERKELGLPDPASAPGPRVYTCNFCPMHSVVTTKKRAMRGMYDS